MSWQHALMIFAGIAWVGCFIAELATTYRIRMKEELPWYTRKSYRRLTNWTR